MSCTTPTHTVVHKTPKGIQSVLILMHHSSIFRLHVVPNKNCGLQAEPSIQPLLRHTDHLNNFRFPHLEEESVAHWVAEAEDKVFLGMFRYGLDNTVLHPHRMLMNAVMVDTQPTIWLVQEKGAP